MDTKQRGDTYGHWVHFPTKSLLGQAMVLCILLSGIMPAYSAEVLAESSSNGEKATAPSKPGKPTVLSSPQAVYIDWPASAEYAVTGYNVGRTETNAAGTHISQLTPINTVPITSVEFNDRTVEKDKYYIYQVQAIAGSQVSPWSDPSAVIQGQWLKLFFPDVYFQPDGLYLWQRTVDEGPLVRIPIAVECAYDISMTGANIWAQLPAELLDIMFTTRTDGKTHAYVEPTGITAGMLYRANAMNEGTIHNYFINSAIKDGVPLYGAGEIFHIYVKPRSVATAMEGALHLVSGEDGVSLYDTSPVPQEIEGLELGGGTYYTAGGCLHGDTDGNNKIDAEDARQILRLITRAIARPTHSCYPSAWDINLDNRVTTQDSTLILRYVEGLPINPPSNLPQKSLLNESFAAAAAHAVEKDSTENPEVFVDSPILEVDASGDSLVSIVGAAPLAGFSITLNYAASELLYEGIALGADLSATDYLLVATNTISGSTNENGVIAVAVTGRESVKKSTTAQLLKVTLKRIAGEVVEAPVFISSFAMNDPYAHAPRHTDPMAPQVTKAPVVPAALFCTVCDSKTNTPINNATVQLSPTSLSASTGTNGIYTFPSLSAAQYTVKVTAPKYQSHSSTVIVNNGASVEKVIKLEAVASAEGEGETEGESAAEGEGEDEKKEDDKKCGLTCGADHNHPRATWCDLLLVCLLIAVLMRFPFSKTRSSQ